MNFIRFGCARPAAPADSVLRRDYDDLQRDYRNSMEHCCRPSSTLTRSNISESKAAFLIHIAAPGLEKSDFKMELDKNILKVWTDKEETTDDQVYTIKEFDYHHFERSYSLPETVDLDKISALYENGILEITLPKKVESMAKSQREIRVE